MSTPFLAEIKIISWNFPPKGWAFCNGQFLPINQNQALFSMLGTMYGGNGQTTFALPDFRGRAPLHVGGGFTQGQAGGQEFHTVTSQEMPAHNHFVNATTNTGNRPIDRPAGNFLANSQRVAVPHRGQHHVQSPAASPTSAAASRTRTGSRSWC